MVPRLRFCSQFGFCFQKPRLEMVPRFGSCFHFGFYFQNLPNSMEYDGFEYFEFFLSILLIFSKSGWSIKSISNSPFPLADFWLVGFLVILESVKVTAWYPFRLIPKTRRGFCNEDKNILPKNFMSHNFRTNGHYRQFGYPWSIIVSHNLWIIMGHGYPDWWYGPLVRNSWPFFFIAYGKLWKFWIFQFQDRSNSCIGGQTLDD